MQVAYVPQSAFIYNATVRDNILFGLPFQQERYDQAIAAAAVRPDLDNMDGKAHLWLIMFSFLFHPSLHVSGFVQKCTDVSLSFFSVSVKCLLVIV